MLVLRSSLELFQERFPGTLEMIEEEDWKIMQVYVTSLKVFVNASKLLAGEKYPVSCGMCHNPCP